MWDVVHFGSVGTVPAAELRAKFSFFLRALLRVAWQPVFLLAHPKFARWRHLTRNLPTCHSASACADACHRRQSCPILDYQAPPEQLEANATARSVTIAQMKTSLSSCGGIRSRSQTNMIVRETEVNRRQCLKQSYAS